MALAYKVATLAFDSTTPPKATFYRTYFWKKKNVNQTARVVVGGGILEKFWTLGSLKTTKYRIKHLITKNI